MTTNPWRRYHKIILQASRSRGIELKRKLCKQLLKTPKCANQEQRKLAHTFYSFQRVKMSQTSQKYVKKHIEKKIPKNLQRTKSPRGVQIAKIQARIVRKWKKIEENPTAHGQRPQTHTTDGSGSFLAL